MGSITAVLVSVVVCLLLACFEPASCSAEDLPAGDSATVRQGEALPGRATHYDITIVKTYPHDPEAFTQGLIFSDGCLYESTGTYQTSSTLRKVDLETGEVLKNQTLPTAVFW